MLRHSLSREPLSGSAQVHIGLDLNEIRFKVCQKPGEILGLLHIETPRQCHPHNASAGMLLENMQSLHNFWPKVTRWLRYMAVCLLVAGVKAHV